MSADELKIIEDIQKGDTEAFEQLVRMYEKKVYSTVLHMVRDRESAQDLAQEVFIRLYTSIGDFKQQSRLSTWIYRVTVNLCIDYTRKQARAPKTAELYVQDEDGEEFARQIADGAPGPDAQAEKAELMEALRAAVGELSNEYRQVFILRDINGLTYEEIAKITDCNLGTVKSRINRAREALRRILIKSGNFFEENKSNTIQEGGARV